MIPARAFHRITVVSLPFAVYFHGSYVLNFKPLKYVVKFLSLLAAHCLLFTHSIAQTDSTKNFNDTAIAILEPLTLTAFGGAVNWKDAPVAVALINKTQLQ